jgi:hypothetical protein
MKSPQAPEYGRRTGRRRSGRGAEELADKRGDVKEALSSERKLFDQRRQDWRGQNI